MLEDNFKELDFDKQVKELQQQYLEEMPEKIDDIDDIILQLENSNEPEPLLQKISRKIHTIKGTAGSYDMGFASTVCHNFEDYLAAIHVSNSKINTQVDNFLKFTCLLREYTEACITDNFHLNKFEEKLTSLIPSYTLNKHRALIIENTKSMAHQYLKVLNSLNIESSFARNGYDALGRLLKENFDSLITVAQTELMDGLSLISALRVINTSNQNIPAILITSDNRIKLSETHKPAYLLKKEPALLKVLSKIYSEIINKTNNTQKPSDIPSKEESIPKPANNLERILYIDDDKEIQPLVKIGLKKFDTLVSVKYYTSAKSALNTIYKFKPDLILMDVMMPEMDGPTALKKLQKYKTFKSIPVIFITAKDSDDEKESLMDLGAAGIINKPFNVKTLANKILDIWSEIQAK